MHQSNLFTLDIKGPYACFTPPWAKVERRSTPVPTPSALRGVFDAIYCKPSEFYWVIRKIEVMKPIQYQSLKCNELASVIAKNRPIYRDAKNEIVQRSMTALRDVHYRVTAELIMLIPDNDFRVRVCDQARRRIQRGACFRQPYLGMKDFECSFAPADMNAKPIPVTQDFGLMTFDAHIPYDNTVGSSRLKPSLYHCMMVDGVIDVPDYDSDNVIKDVYFNVGREYKPKRTTKPKKGAQTKNAKVTV